MKPTLLCYNLTGERGRKIRFAAMGLSIKLRNVEENEYQQPLSALCGLADAGEAIPPEGLLHKFLTLLIRLLEITKLATKKNCLRIGLQACV